MVADPGDMAPGKGRLSSLAPWVALQKHAALVLTTEEGTDVESAVWRSDSPARPLANRRVGAGRQPPAIPMEKRPNPAPGKDTEITLEPLTPTGTSLFSFAIGRLFHEEPGMIPLMLARAKLLPKGPAERKR